MIYRQNLLGFTFLIHNVQSEEGSEVGHTLPVYTGGSRPRANTTYTLGSILNKNNGNIYALHLLDSRLKMKTIVLFALGELRQLADYFTILRATKRIGYDLR